MSTTFNTLKKVEFEANSKDEAKAKVEEIFGNYVMDATPAFKKFKESKSGIITDRDLKEFMANMIAKKIKNVPGAGMIITLKSAVTNTRERPYKIESIKREGQTKWKSFYKWIDKETGKVVAQVDTNKADANNAVKDLYKSGEYTGTAELIPVKEVIEGSKVLAVAHYTPSKNATPGQYIAFGLEA
jgi:hypothetical protein